MASAQLLLPARQLLVAKYVCCYACGQHCRLCVLATATSIMTVMRTSLCFEMIRSLGNLSSASDAAPRVKVKGYSVQVSARADGCSHRQAGSQSAAISYRLIPTKCLGLRLSEAWA